MDKKLESAVQRQEAYISKWVRRHPNAPFEPGTMVGDMRLVLNELYTLNFQNPNFKRQSSQKDAESLSNSE